MNSYIIRHHASDSGIALLYSPQTDEFWIGEYFPQATHQNGEPPYVWIAGNWSSEDEALISLSLFVY